MVMVPSNLIPTRITQLPTAPVASEDGLLLFVYNGVTYKVRAGDLIPAPGVPTSRQVLAGTGLTGGGALSSDVTLAIAAGGVGPSQLAATGVVAGTYGDATNVPSLTVDASGRVTAASLVPITRGAAVYSGTAILDFGAFPGSNEAFTTVAGQSAITSATVVTVQVVGSGASGSHTSNDHRYFAALTGLTHGTPTDGDGFVIYARSTEKMQGTFLVQWSYTV